MDAEHLILGAGCAGLALAAALVDAGVREEILLVERRTRFENDRTWCFWDTGDIPWAHLSTRRWEAWSVLTSTGRHVRRAQRIPYAHLPADVYAEALLARLARVPNVTVRTGVAVRVVESHGGIVRVATSAGELRAARAYDALGGSGPLAREAGDAGPGPGEDASEGPGAAPLRQRFLGQEVRTERPVFDPMVATLMDFRVGQQDGVHFVYVLPFTAHTALVEDTSIGTVASAPDVRRETIARYLATDFEVVREERGSLPMTTRAHPAEPLPRVWSVGTAAGAVRPSSGYAFARIQRHASALARAVARGEDRPPPPPGGRRGTELDRMFLAALARRPEAFPALFANLVDRVPADAFARFMSDASSPLDELRVAAAIPTLPLLLAAQPGRARVDERFPPVGPAPA